MAIFLLDGTESARLAQRALMVSVSVDARRGGSARLVARVASGGSSPVIEDRPDLIIVPYVETEIVISAVPGAGARQFGEETTLFVTVAPDTRNPNVDSIQVSPHEVSGRENVDLLRLAPGSSDDIVVTRIGGEDIPLSPLANRARVACRGALGVNAFDAGLQVSVGCVIDASASMAALVTNGAVGAATELFAGVAAAVAGDQAVRTVLADNTFTDVPAGSLAGLRGRVTDAIDATGFGVGADLDAAVAQVSQTAQLTVVITDAPLRSYGSQAKVSWMTLAESTIREPGFAGALLPPPPPGADGDTFYNEHPHLVDAAVAALVAPLRNAPR